MEEQNQQLEGWEHNRDYIRPYQALDYLTPVEYYQTWIEAQGPNCHEFP
jgi:transposase InsO family protein